MIRAILAFIVVFLLATFPATWLLMLFFGNVGMALSYWGTFPLGILVSVLLGGVTAPKYADCTDAPADGATLAGDPASGEQLGLLRPGTRRR